MSQYWIQGAVKGADGKNIYHAVPDLGTDRVWQGDYTAAQDAVRFLQPKAPPGDHFTVVNGVPPTGTPRYPVERLVERPQEPPA